MQRTLKQAGLSHYLMQIEQKNIVRIVDVPSSEIVWSCEIRHLRAYMPRLFETDAPIDNAMGAITGEARNIQWDGPRN